MEKHPDTYVKPPWADIIKQTRELLLVHDLPAEDRRFIESEAWRPTDVVMRSDMARVKPGSSGPCYVRTRFVSGKDIFCITQVYHAVWADQYGSAQYPTPIGFVKVSESAARVDELPEEERHG